MGNYYLSEYCTQLNFIFSMFSYRPIAGSVNFCPSAFDGGKTDDFVFTVAKHELLHALVSHLLFKLN